MTRCRQWEALCAALLVFVVSSAWAGDKKECEKPKTAEKNCCDDAKFCPSGCTRCCDGQNQKKQSNRAPRALQGGTNGAAPRQYELRAKFVHQCDDGTENVGRAVAIFSAGKPVEMRSQSAIHDIVINVTPAEDDCVILELEASILRPGMGRESKAGMAAATRLPMSVLKWDLGDAEAGAARNWIELELAPVAPPSPLTVVLPNPPPPAPVMFELPDLLPLLGDIMCEPPSDEPLTPTPQTVSGLLQCAGLEKAPAPGFFLNLEAATEDGKCKLAMETRGFRVTSCEALEMDIAGAGHFKFSTANNQVMVAAPTFNATADSLRSSDSPQVIVLSGNVCFHQEKNGTQVHVRGADVAVHLADGHIEIKNPVPGN